VNRIPAATFRAAAEIDQSHRSRAAFPVSAVQHGEIYHPVTLGVCLQRAA
jgi:hypothetical protein